MVKYLAGVLSVIAVGVVLIAYGLLVPRASAFGHYGDPGMARPVMAGQQLPLADDPYYARSGFNYPSATYLNPAVPAAASYTAAPPVRPVQTVVTKAAPPRVVTRTVERPRRDWGKTALVIGGSTAAGAGIGGIVGGKKGALIGAAIGGGGSTLFETLKK